MIKKKCLVIGGNGFIGQNLIQLLIDNQFDVTVFDIAISNVKTLLNENTKQVKFVEGDVNNTQYLMESAINCPYVIWLIHTTVPATSMYDVEFDLQSNIPPLIRFVVESIKRNSLEKFVYLSSGGTVYGNPDVDSPIVENYPKKPISSYGLTKLVAEEYLTFLFAKTTVKSFILRPSNVYGKYQNLKKPQGLIGHVLKSVIKDETIIIYGDGTIVRDYLHVYDLSEAILRCLDIESVDEYPKILNVGSGKPTSINQIIDHVSGIIGYDVKKEHLPNRDFDCKYNVLSIESAKDYLDWKPKISLEDGLLEVWNWIRNINK